MLQPETRRGDMLQGTLDLLVLRTLSVQSLHGYAIAQHIERLSQAVLRVEQGSLYPALERLQRNGWITSKWGKTPTGRKARYYSITSSGRQQLDQKTAAYQRLTGAIARVLRHA